MEDHKEDKTELTGVVTSCKECVFAMYVGDTQMDCSLGRLEMFGKSGDIVATSDHIKDLQKQSNKWLASVTNKNEKWWATSTVKDLYLSPNECLKMGIVDKIVD